MHDATLCFLLSGKDNVVLGLKKRGFAQGKWNGYGGKVNPGESIECAAARELEEESGISVQSHELEKAAVLEFRFTNPPAGQSWDQRVHVFIAKNWEGEPMETEEMRPKNYRYDELPYKEMWEDDPDWLPLVLSGKKVMASFVFAKDNKSIADKRIEIVKNI